MLYRRCLFIVTLLGGYPLVLGCGGDESPADEPTGAELDPQVPPSSAAGMPDWLAAFERDDWEDAWVCEAEATEKSAGAPGIHVHGSSNRVCNNLRLAEARLSGSEQVPVGSAALKFVAAGTYVEVKAQADSADGDGWFWYSPDGSVAELGASACTACHAAAGSDAEHPGLGDFVYFQVQGG